MEVAIFIILTAFLWGIAPIFDKMALKNSMPFAGLVVRSVIVTVLLIIFTFISGKFKEVINIDVKSVIYYTLSGLTAGCIGVFTYYKALQISPTSKIVPLAATYPFVTAVLSLLFLGEHLTLTRFIGIILIIAGIMLVK